MQDPAAYVEKLIDLTNIFVAIDYTGYSIDPEAAINLADGQILTQINEEANGFKLGFMLRGEEEIIEVAAEN